MQTVHILNPAAGQGGATRFKHLDNVYLTKSQGDATAYILNYIKTNGPANFKVYGGDGTINEVVNGIVTAATENVLLTPVPVGTGNDLVRTVNETSDKPLKCDVLTLNDGYSVNAINTGFDLTVVQRAATFKTKPLISGSLAYMLGVISALFSKYGRYIKVKFTDKNGVTDTFEGDSLLCVASNGRYYGGGFKSAPVADITDGLIDLLIIKKVSRLKFITLIGAYKKGKHIDPETNTLTKRFKKIALFKQCKRVIIEGIEDICADGEVLKTNLADIGIIPGAVTIVPGEV